MSSQKLFYMPDVEDSELVARAQKGDREAFSRLVARYYERVFQTLYTLVGDRDDAEDLTQEVFIKAYRSIHRFRSDARFFTWLYRISYNCFVDWTKGRKRKGGIARDPAWWGQCDAEDGLFVQAKSPDERAFQGKLGETLEDALQTLSPDYRAVVVMREWEGFSYLEIARMLNCSVGTVKSRLFRAKAQLQKVLQPAYQEWVAA